MANSIDLQAFVKTYGEIHAADGKQSDVAEATGLSASQVKKLSDNLREQGVPLPAFRRGRKTAVFATISTEQAKSLSALL